MVRREVAALTLAIVKGGEWGWRSENTALTAATAVVAAARHSANIAAQTPTLRSVPAMASRSDRRSVDNRGPAAAVATMATRAAAPAGAGASELRLPGPRIPARDRQFGQAGRALPLPWGDARRL